LNGIAFGFSTESPPTFGFLAFGEEEGGESDT
jgi:hypothetical protein